MTYDWQDGYLLLFGGMNYIGWQTNSTWANYGNAWNNISTAHAPSPRDEAAMAYDPIDHDVVLFGGTNSTSIGLGDTWAPCRCLPRRRATPRRIERRAAMTIGDRYGCDAIKFWSQVGLPGTHSWLRASDPPSGWTS
jgi:hypothetical protein